MWRGRWVGVGFDVLEKIIDLIINKFLILTKKTNVLRCVKLLSLKKGGEKMEGWLKGRIYLLRGLLRWWNRGREVRDCLEGFIDWLRDCYDWTGAPIKRYYNRVIGEAVEPLARRARFLREYGLNNEVRLEDVFFKLFHCGETSYRIEIDNDKAEFVLAEIRALEHAWQSIIQVTQEGVHKKTDFTIMDIWFVLI